MQGQEGITVEAEEIVFVETLPPPKQSSNGGAWAGVAEKLRDRPGEWAFVGRVSPSTSTQIKRGLLRGFAPAGDFEAVTRNQADGKADVYARYVGEV